MIGFGYAVMSVILPSSEPLTLKSPPVEDETDADDVYTIVTLGDSLTRGTGDATGKGYAGVVKDKLEELKEEQIAFYQFAIEGYTSEQLLDDLMQAAGVIEGVKKADLILMTIGGNDLFSSQDEINIEAAEQKKGPTLERISQIFELLNQYNSQAEILYIALYNPFMEIDQNHEISESVMDWNHQIQLQANPLSSVTVIPTYDLFKKDQERFLSEDHYHPNQAGYERIAERIYQYLQ